ncbi:hypothetical protein ACNKHO_17550 [Shigella flexneri]
MNLGLGMKVQAVDMTEITRRIDQKFMTKRSWRLRWRGRQKTSATAKDQNAQQYKRNEAQSRVVLKESWLMAMCIRDMMQGNKVAIKGWLRNLLAITPLPAFQGQRHWTDQTLTVILLKR